MGRPGIFGARGYRASLLASALVAAALAAAPSASAQESLAASCGPADGFVGFTANDSTDFRAAQTFTPQLGGLLSRVEIVFQERTDGLGDYLVDIRTTTAGGAPSSTVLASTTVPDAQVPANRTNTPVDAFFPFPASVVAGQTYALVSGRPHSPDSSIFWGTSRDCPGDAFLSNDGGVTWSPTSSKFAFSAFVTPVAPPAAPTPAASQLSCKGEPATHVGTRDGEVIEGTDGRDVMLALGGRDRILAGGGDDLICANGGRDVIRGQGGEDEIFGGRGKDRLFGNNGDDELAGGAGRDSLYGGSGDDRLRGGSPGGNGDNSARDRCRGGKGDDVLESCER